MPRSRMSLPRLLSPSRLYSIRPFGWWRWILADMSARTDVQQTITLTKRFWIGTHEISQKEFESVMGSNPSFFKGETLPVEKVKFDQAVEFCRALTTWKDRKGG